MAAGPGIGSALRATRSRTPLAPERHALSLVVLAALALACEYPGVPHPLGTVDTGPAGFAMPVGSAPESAAQASPAAGSAGDGAATLAATIKFKDFQLDPDSVTVLVGKVRFTLVNEGRYTHDFRIEGNGVDDRSPRIGASRTLEWGYELKPGEYRISCPISNHADRGMTGTLVVQGR